MIAQHLSEGRHLFVMLDPQPLIHWPQDLEEYGIYVGDDIILEPNMKCKEETYPISSSMKIL